MEFSFRKKGFKKQAKEEVNAIKSNEKDKLKQIEGIFSQNLMNDLIRDKLKEIANLQVLLKQMISVIKQKVHKFIIFNKWFH